MTTLMEQASGTTAGSGARATRRAGQEGAGSRGCRFWRTVGAAVLLAALVLPGPAAGAGKGTGTGTGKPTAQGRRMVVTSTAYTSRPSETDGRPHETACKDLIRPGDKTVAVSGDLYKRGLTCGARIKIDGLEGEYVVNDKLPARKRNHVDLYAGMSVREAKTWGTRRVGIVLLAPGNSPDKPVCTEACEDKEKANPAAPISSEKEDGQPLTPIPPDKAAVVQ